MKEGGSHTAARDNTLVFLRGHLEGLLCGVTVSGAVALPRGVRWRLGEPVPRGVYYNRIICEDPIRYHNYNCRSVL